MAKIKVNFTFSTFTLRQKKWLILSSLYLALLLLGGMRLVYIAGGWNLLFYFFKSRIKKPIRKGSTFPSSLKK
ncbi:hypothetical protein HY612_02480 [Candidatus Roizmanbacteria bacterium]|nr:hypothetical protein [Candidatus Roizmanbacteria bacterium]